jgi:cytochrome c oxidase subunit 3
MLISLIFLGSIMAVVAWWLVKQSLNTQPWVSEPHGEGTSEESFSYPAHKVGLWVFLGVVSSLFCLIISAYSIRMAGLGDWRPLPEPPLLWLNTGLLVLSSVFMQRAHRAASRNELDRLASPLLIGGALAIAFIVGQLAAWYQLGEMGYFASANPANAFFYMITGLHGLHMLGGLVAWRRAVARVVSKKGMDISDVRTSVELCTTYWHFLLLIWLILFGLMLAT